MLAVDTCTASPLRAVSFTEELVHEESRSEVWPAQNVTLLRCIGKGATSLVFEACDGTGTQRLAVKVTSAPGEGLSTTPEMQALDRLSAPSHPNVAGWVQTPLCVEGWGLAIAGHVPQRVMVQAFQLCAGDLVTAVQSQPHGVLGERAARHVFTQVVEGLTHCHAQGVWHLDIKPDNILVCADGSVKVADFGCASLVRHTSQRCGTPEYACPEAVHTKMASQVAPAAPLCLALPVPVAPCQTAPRRSVSATEAVPPESPRACSGARCSEGDSSSGAGGSCLAVPSACSADARRVSDPAAGLAGFATLDADKADVWALGITMAACTFGNFPWSLAHSTDAAYSAWQSAWTYILAAAAGGGSSDATGTTTPLAADTHRSVTSREAKALGHLLLQCCGAVPEAGAAQLRQAPVSHALLDLLVRMLDPRPEARLSMAQVATHEWMTGVSVC